MIFATHLCITFFTACLLYMYIRDKRVQTVSNIIFKRILMSVVGLTLMDSTVLVVMNSKLLDVIASNNLIANAVIFMDKFRVVFVMLLVFNIFEYCILNALPHFKIKLAIKVILSVIPLFLPASIDFDAHTITGFHNHFMYISLVIGVIFFFFFIIKYFHNLDRVKANCAFAWLGVLFVGEIYNIAFKDNSIAVFSCFIGSLLLFYYIENPKAYVDPMTGFFNTYFLKEYVDSCGRWNRPAYIGVIYSKVRYFDVDLIKSLAGNSIYCFKDTDSHVYIVGEDKDSLVDLLKFYRDKEESLIMLYKHSPIVAVDLFIAYVKQYSHVLSNRTLHILSTDDIRKLDDEERVRMEIVHALVENRILTYIQPIYDIRAGKFTAGECLCRLKRSNGDIMSPGEFIPVAERTGLITNIESVMFTNLCKCLSDERIRNSGIQYLDINLSIKKGEQHTLVSEYVSILNEYSINAGMINLEITETDIVEEKLSILNNMQLMREHGFRFSLDDFGTGESNLGYIIDMPVSTIKFDKELTQKAVVDNKAKLILKRVIQMAHDLNISVVIEGVETEPDFDLCKELDADYVQGYYFSKPVPIDEFMLLI